MAIALSKSYFGSSSNNLTVDHFFMNVTIIAHLENNMMLIKTVKKIFFYHRNSRLDKLNTGTKEERCHFWVSIKKNQNKTKQKQTV